MIILSTLPPYITNLAVVLQRLVWRADWLPLLYCSDLSGGPTGCRCCMPRTAAVPVSVKPVLNRANVCSPNILRTLRRTRIRFLIEHLVRRIWFGQSRLYFILNLSLIHI